MRLSVIVPFRDVEPYLEKCLESLAAQARPIDELILVDDGSRDGSRQIAERFKASHSANTLLLDSGGKGAAAARNAGLDAASGDWVAFVDGDDWAEPELYRVLVDLAEARDLDIAHCNGRYHFEGRRPDHPVYRAGEALAGPVPGKAWLAHKIRHGGIFHAVWMHVYRRRFVEQHRLRFTEGLMHEDVTWTTRALLLAARVAYDERPLYVYRRQPRSFTREALDARLLRVIDTAVTDAELLAAMADSEEDASAAGAVRWQLVDGALSVFHKIRQLSSPSLKKEETKKLLDRKFFSLLWRNAQDFRQRRKIAARYLRALVS